MLVHGALSNQLFAEVRNGRCFIELKILAIDRRIISVGRIYLKHSNLFAKNRPNDSYHEEQSPLFANYPHYTSCGSKPCLKHYFNNDWTMLLSCVAQIRVNLRFIAKRMRIIYWAIPCPGI